MENTINPGDIFPIPKRTRSGDQIGVDLSGIDIPDVSKDWACKGFNGELKEDAHWKALDIGSDCHSLGLFCDLFNFKKDSVRTRWLKNYRKGKQKFAREDNE